MSWCIPGRRHGLLYCSKDSVAHKRKLTGFVLSRYFIVWMGSVSSIDVILDGLNVSTGWGRHDLLEIHIPWYMFVEHASAVINCY